MQDQDIVRDFLVESYENLARLDQELVELEKKPGDTELLASIFRTIHTIKGTSGFLNYHGLGRITHQAESLLSQLRDGERGLTPPLVSLILETVDVVRKILLSIEATGEEGPLALDDLEERLRAEVVAGTAPEALPMRPTPAAEPRREAERESVETVARPQISVTDSNIRVGVGLLDKLMDLVGELVLTRNQILQVNTEREDAALSATSQRLNLITSELQEGVMKTRMQPIGTVWNKLPRVVRDVAVSLGKDIRIEMEGEETELDRTIIEAIKDPLVHLVRNSCDHGVEKPARRTAAGKPAQGRLSLRAYHEGGQVNIEISDDGGGIDPARVRQKAIASGLIRPEQADKLTEREMLNLIFAPGFSTAAEVTSISGRGVGMDVVRTHIERIGGVVDVFSRVGEGTTVKIKIPLTLAIIPGLVVTGGGERFVIPQVSLLELVRLEGDSSSRQIECVHGTPVYRRRGYLLPIAYLSQVLGFEAAANGEAVNVVVLQAEDRQFGLVVDSINDTQEIVVKPLSKQLKGLTVYAGATIMGDGRVALILDVLGIGQRSGVLSELREPARGSADGRAPAGSEQQRLLLVRAGSYERLAVPLSMVARLEEFPRGSIERAGGHEVVQYRDRILPLVDLPSVLGTSPAFGDADPAQVVVFSDGPRSLGVVVDQILDIAEETVTVRNAVSSPGILGSAVVGKRVTDFLDLAYVLQAASGYSSQAGRGGGPNRRVLLAEHSSFDRGLLRASLDMAGYRVTEAGSIEEAVDAFERQPADVILAASDLPSGGPRELHRRLRPQDRPWQIPMLVLVDDEGSSEDAAGFSEYANKLDRAGMLASVARLAAAVGQAASESAIPGKALNHDTKLVRN